MNPIRSALLSVLLLACVAPVARAQQTAPGVGDAAPAFAATADDGQTWRSRDHVGKSLLVVYFYPAAFTSGCTKQACEFRDHRSQLEELGAQVVAISGDDVENLRAFKGSHRLNFPLLSDADGTIARAFGVPVRSGGVLKSTVDGREVELKRGVTSARWTFIIGRDGRILYKDTEVDPEGDSRTVIRAIQRLDK
jgi:peroxiredoxin Q/BCP